MVHVIKVQKDLRAPSARRWRAWAIVGQAPQAIVRMEERRERRLEAVRAVADRIEKIGLLASEIQIVTEEPDKLSRAATGPMNESSRDNQCRQTAPSKEGARGCAAETEVPHDEHWQPPQEAAWQPEDRRPDELTEVVVPDGYPRHRFGHFVVPAKAHIKGFDGFKLR